MVDRIERPDSPLHRILEADKSGDEEKQRRQFSEEEEKKDSFGKKPSWEKIITKPMKARGSNPLLTKEELSRSMMIPDEEEESWTWRLQHQPLVALGILDIDAKPRWGMIATYLLGLGGLVISALLFVRVFYP
ncbi:MAG: hypothetical protein Q7S98_00050 [Deltaproteobacteria bacterium]|nr:hypothetical protein [Deltaproteobacteria bacterium]